MEVYKQSIVYCMQSNVTPVKCYQIDEVYKHYVNSVKSDEGIQRWEIFKKSLKVDSNPFPKWSNCIENSSHYGSISKSTLHNIVQATYNI